MEPVKHKPWSQDVLHTIYKLEILGKKDLLEEARRIYEILSTEMDLSRQEVKLLAFIRYGLGSKTLDTFIKVFNLTRAEMMRTMDKLLKTDYVEVVMDIDDNLTYLVNGYFEEELMQIDAMYNFTESQLHTSVKSFADEIRHGKDVLSEGCRIMERIFRINPQLQFSKGYAEMNATEFSLNEKSALFLMAGTFISQGMRPFNGEQLGNDWQRSEERLQSLQKYIRRIKQDKYKTAEEDDEPEEAPDERRSYGHTSFSLDFIKKGIHDLVGRGLVSVIPDEGYNENRNNSNKQLYLLSCKACGLLFHGMTHLIDYSSLSQQANIIRSCDIKKKNLYFDECGDRQLEMLKTVVMPERYAQYVENLHKRGMAGTVTALFFGESGTGKTELVLQLARESGRDVFVADAAKLFGSYWGESEKNMRELFRGFRYLNQLSVQAPILLFNEADGIIGKRMEAVRSIDKAENAVQTIVLQELENFEGIFVAITNLANHLDDAFDRRFAFKIEFFNPSPQTAANIWKAKIPELTAEEVIKLASHFPFCGGKIENVAKNRILLEAVNNAPVSMQEMMELCRDEELKSEGQDKYYRHFQIVKSSSIRPCKLYYDEDLLRSIDMIRKLIVTEQFNEIVKGLKHEGLSGSVNILFHGAPGTGKTELARQLARESGRDLYIVDVSKLQDGLMGSGTRNVRELFAKFRHIQKTSDKAPIMLFNEADGMIGKRLQVERASDKDENALQSVLLQELENFEGIFIATTNLMENIDAAFDRRFLFKVEFHKPSTLTAARIWRARIPELDDQEAQALAEEFSFSGGQIENVAKRRALCKTVYQRTPTFEEMSQYCKDEDIKARNNKPEVLPTRGFTHFMNN